MALIGAQHLKHAGTRKQQQVLVLVGSMLLVLSIIYSVHYVEGRHRWAAEPLLLLISAVGTVQASLWISGSRNEANAEKATVKIVRIITRMNIGGPSVHVTLLAGLKPQRFSTYLITGQCEAREGDLIGCVQGSSVKVVRLNALRRSLSPWHDAIALVQICRILWREEPHIIHTHMAKAGALGRLAALIYNKFGSGRLPQRQAKLVHTFHGHVLEGYFSSRMSQLFITIERWLARRTDHLIAVSPTIRDDLLNKGIGRLGQWRVIPLGLDLSLLTELPSQSVRAPLRVGIVGRLVPVKNPSLFLHALANANQREPATAAYGVVIGDGPLRETLEREARQLGLERWVEFQGWRYDLPAVYQDLDAACITSWNEGTPVSLIEAMAAARPVVATDVGGVRDLLDESAKEEAPVIAIGGYRIASRGILVRAGDVAGLSAALSRLVADASLRQQLGQAARRYVVAHYTHERLLCDMSQLYEEVIRGGCL